MKTTSIDVRIDTLGRVALLTVLAEDPQSIIDRAPAYRVVRGQVGSMDVQKIIAAIETAARRERLIGPEYAEEHALYHAAIEALYGVTRGQIALGTLLRTVGLRFSLVKGPRFDGDATTWLAVALYGTIGQPVKGMEHEVIGLGVFHLYAA